MTQAEAILFLMDLITEVLAGATLEMEDYTRQILDADINMTDSSVVCFETYKLTVQSEI